MNHSHQINRFFIALFSLAALLITGCDRIPILPPTETEIERMKTAIRQLNYNRYSPNIIHVQTLATVLGRRAVPVEISQSAKELRAIAIALKTPGAAKDHQNLPVDCFVTPRCQDCRGLGYHVDRRMTAYSCPACDGTGSLKEKQENVTKTGLIFVRKQPAGMIFDPHNAWRAYWVRLDVIRSYLAEFD